MTRQTVANSGVDAFKGTDMDLICVTAENKQEAHLAIQAMVLSSLPQNRDRRIHASRVLYALFGSVRPFLSAAVGHGKVDTSHRAQANPAGFLRVIHRNSRTLALAALGLTMTALAAMSPAALASENRAQAPATLPSVQVQGFELQRKDFRFGQFSGWLKRDGTWHIEGPVRHNGLLCGTYEVGVRFGMGEQGCTNVQWISDVSYVTSNEQCNNAERPHSGTEIDDALAGQFDAITCAERVIRCTGTCK
jgi:hypothetical protein